MSRPALHDRTPELPALLKARVDPTRLHRVSEIVKAYGPPARDGIHLFSNDYLSFSNHPDIVRCMLEATAYSTDSLWMSSVFFEDDSPQRKLERRFADYVGAEDCVLAQSGYCANLGLMQSIAGPSTNVYIDECAHASLWHGVLASRATPRRFANNEPAALEKLLREMGPGIVVIDTVYSHNGVVCPLREMVELGARYECVVVVDESHSLGTHGPRGAGMVVELGIERLVHFRTASLAKAFVARAGIVAGTESTCQMLRYTAGPAIFSSACMSHDLAGVERALDLIIAADDRRARLHAIAASVRERLAALGYGIVSQSQIIAIESGVETETIRLRRFLEQNGIYGSGFCAPVTRLHESLVRLSINAGLGDSELDRVVAVCEAARAHVGFRDWASTRRAAGAHASG